MNAQGGAEYLALQMMKLLKESGHDVILGTFTGFDPNKVRKNFGFAPQLHDRFSVLERPFPYFGIYQRMILGDILKELKSSCDVVINTHASPHYETDITYFHGVADYSSSSLFKKIYSWPFKRMIEKSIHHSGIFLANSMFTTGKVSETYGVLADVLYPPVDVFTSRSYFTNLRDNIVLTIARASYEKQLWKILDIARLVHEYNANNHIQFHLVTSVHNIESARLLNKVQRQINSSASLADRVFIHQNISQSKKQELLLNAKVYLQPSTLEHFSISTVEAISYGLYPVVPSIGGSKEIVDGISNSVYSNAVEAARLISKAIDHWNRKTVTIYSQKMDRFSVQRFGLEMLSWINKVMN